MMKLLVLCSLTVLLLCESAMAQAPIIVQPANQTAPAQTARTQATSGDSEVQAAVKTLEEMKAANEELLKKQQATLEALDQLQKDAEQLRIFAKRG